MLGLVPAHILAPLPLLVAVLELVNGASGGEIESRGAKPKAPIAGTTENEKADQENQDTAGSPAESMGPEEARLERRSKRCLQTPAREVGFGKLAHLNTRTALLNDHGREVETKFGGGASARCVG